MYRICGQENTFLTLKGPYFENFQRINEHDLDLIAQVKVN